LGVTSADVEKVVYFAGYIVTKVFEEEKLSILKDWMPNLNQEQKL
jgi:hypothetical protein